jgi:hypothetical protein
MIVQGRLFFGNRFARLGVREISRRDGRIFPGRVSGGIVR